MYRFMMKSFLLFVIFAYSFVIGFPQEGKKIESVDLELSKISDVDFTGLSETQKRIALNVMKDNPCNCGCKMTIATCRHRDISCRRSLIFARTIVDSLREGKQQDDVVRVLRAKANTFVEARLPDDAGVVYDIDVTHNPSRGPEEAPVSIIEFSDFQCPFCAGIQKTLDRVLEAFPDKVRLIYKQYPLNIHSHARRAAAASLAAHNQGRFWELHDKMFENFSAINDANIRNWAKEIGLDMDSFDQNMNTGQQETLIRKDIADGAAAKVLGTPTLFVNGRKVQDRSFEGFKKMIQEELANRSEASTSSVKKTATGGRN